MLLLFLKDNLLEKEESTRLFSFLLLSWVGVNKGYGIEEQDGGGRMTRLSGVISPDTSPGVCGNINKQRVSTEGRAAKYPVTNVGVACLAAGVRARQRLTKRLNRQVVFQRGPHREASRGGRGVETRGVE